MSLFYKRKPSKKEHLVNNKWTLMVFAILIAGASCISYQYAMMSQERIPHFYDIILDQTNGLLDICLIIPFVWLLVTGNPKSNIYRGNLKTFSVLKNMAVVNIICLLCFYSINLIVYSVLSGLKNPFINYWTANNQMYRMGFLPMEACCLSLLLLFIRMNFLTLVSLIISIVTDSEIKGFAGIIFICLFDWKFYEWFKIYEPAGLLLTEHSRILYTGGYAPMSRSDTRISFGATALFWLVLYSIGIYLFIRFRGKKLG